MLTSTSLASGSDRGSRKAVPIRRASRTTGRTLEFAGKHGEFVAAEPGHEIAARMVRRRRPPISTRRHRRPGGRGGR